MIIQAYFEKTIVGVDCGHYSVEARFLRRYETQKRHLVDQSSRHVQRSEGGVLNFKDF